MSNKNESIMGSKYQLELNSKYVTSSKKGSGTGNNTKESIINIIKQQSNNSK